MGRVKGTGGTAGGRIGVYPLGVLSVAFFERLKAEEIIGRASGATSRWAGRLGRLSIDGKPRDIRCAWRRGLTTRNGPLPELILASPYAHRLDSFLAELMGLFRELDHAGARRLVDVPFFLMASSGVYHEKLLDRAVRLVERSTLSDKKFFALAVQRRLFRAAAYQSGVRHGSGPGADYRVGREKARLVLSRSGTPEDRARVLRLLRARGYPVSLEGRPGEGEFDKALLNVACSSLTQLYSVHGGALVRVRFGDLLPAARLPPGFRRRRLASPACAVRARMMRLASAVTDIAVSHGAFARGVRPTAKMHAIETYLGREISAHLPSSQQVFFERLLDPPGGFTPGRLLPTEAAVIEPLLAMAREDGLTGAARELAALRRDLLSAYAAAWAVRRATRAAAGDLALRLVSRRGPAAGSALVAAIDGLPGSGKTTLAAGTAAALRRLGFAAEVVCIDDFYYTAAERHRRGLKAWGPDAHDLRLAALLGRLKRGLPVRLPVFDKRLRTRARVTRRLAGPLDFILFEGFGVSLAARGYKAFSRHADVFCLIDAAPAACRRWRLAAGWKDRRAQLGRAAFLAEFESIWRDITAQARQVLPAARARAHFTLRAGAGHRLYGLKERA